MPCLRESVESTFFEAVLGMDKAHCPARKQPNHSPRSLGGEGGERSEPGEGVPSPLFSSSRQGPGNINGESEKR
jgi:hypothetical protein